MTDELAASRKLNDYSEMNLKGWIQRLKELQEIMNSSLNVDIVDEIDEASTIHFITFRSHWKQREHWWCQFILVWNTLYSFSDHGRPGLMVFFGHYNLITRDNPKGIRNTICVWMVGL
jgi:hypothetical protein